jgi:hypothetical protein
METDPCDGKTCGTSYKKYPNGKHICIHNNLEILYPKISEQWNYELNKGVPKDYLPGSSTQVWWKCQNIECGCKTWSSYISSRTSKDTGCYCCSGRFCPHNNLTTTHPKMLDEWDYTKNDKLPSEYTYGSHASVFWKCLKSDCGCHNYEMVIKDKILRESECPFCSRYGQRPCKHYNAEICIPSLALEWDYNKNLNLPSDYLPCSNVEVFLICTKNKSHQWKTSIHNRNKGIVNCRDCKIIERENYNLLTEFPLVCKEWDYDVNDFLPQSYAPHSNKYVWWSCKNNTLHKWKTSIYHRTKDNPTGCPFCNSSRLSDEYNLAVYNPELCSEWDYEKNDTNPKEHTPYSGDKVWWKCKKNPEHSWETTINHRSNGTGCPFCNSSMPSDEYNLYVCNIQLSSEWDYDKNNTFPSDYTPYSSEKVWWKCKKNPDHSWKTTIYSRNKKIDPTGCPKCCTNGYSKLQIEWLNYVSEQEHINIIHAENGGEYHIQNIGKVDGYCKENNTVYEFHGDFYHGNPIKYNSSDINPKTYKSYGELYDKTLKRDEMIISKDYKLVTMWEYEFLKLRKQINKDIKDLNKTKLQIVKEPIKIEIKPIKKLRLRLIVNDTK